MGLVHYLNEIGQRGAFDVVKFCRQNEASSGDAFPVGLVDDDFEDELLEVDVGHRQRQEVETTFRHRDSSHLAFDAENYKLHYVILQTQI